MGFLSEDRALFKKRRLVSMDKNKEDREDSDGAQVTVGTTTNTTTDEYREKAMADTQKAHDAMKKTIPLCIGS